MYIDPLVIVAIIGFISGIVISKIYDVTKSYLKSRSINKVDNSKSKLGSSAGIINDERKERKLTENKSIDTNFIIRDCLEFYLENDNLSQILNASACDSIKCSIRAISDHVKIRFDGYVRSNFYMYDISFLYELTDEEIDNAIDKYVEDYIGKRKKVQEKILIALNTEVGVEVDPRLKDKSFTNIKRAGELDEVDIFRESGFYSTSDSYDVRF